jgi:pimeloyl-ACP methyl ester carboxylesterase
MADLEPVASAAAAAALSTWQRVKEQPVPQPLERARELVQAYARSDVAGAQQIARAAGGEVESVRPDLSAAPREPPAEGGTTSLIVHGTWPWDGDWWLVGGDFHTYVRSDVRRDVFSGRNAFWWSGAYKPRHRSLAAGRLAGWVEDTVGGPLNTVFAHSYGGSITMHATTYGLKMREVVLLAAASLQLIGLRNATDIIGGFRAWKAADLPIAAPATPTRPRLAEE